MADARVALAAKDNAKLLYRVAYGIVRNAAVAEEVCQDALLQLTRSTDQVRDWSAVRAWLVRTTTNAAVQRVRRAKLERRTVLQRPAPPDASDDDFLLRQKLLDRLADMDADLRDVVVLRVMQGHSGVETQRLLGLSAVEVSRRLHAGLARLRGAMRERPGTKTETPPEDA